MMIAANVPEEMKFKLYYEAFTCDTILDQLTIIEIFGVSKTRVEHWCGELSRCTRALRTWSEAGVVNTETKTTEKGKPRGIACMFVGYALGNAAGVYIMWNQKTNRVLETRGVTWLKKMYYQKPHPGCEIILREESN